jgi:hypothetical protein
MSYLGMFELKRITQNVMLDVSASDHGLTSACCSLSHCLEYTARHKKSQELFFEKKFS